MKESVFYSGWSFTLIGLHLVSSNSLCTCGGGKGGKGWIHINGHLCVSASFQLNMVGKKGEEMRLEVGQWLLQTGFGFHGFSFFGASSEGKGSLGSGYVNFWL